MAAIFLVIQLVLAIALIGVVMVQKSSTSGLGLGEGGSGAGLQGFLSGRGSANFLTRATALIATGFLVSCLISAILATQGTTGRSISTELSGQSLPGSEGSQSGDSLPQPVGADAAGSESSGPSLDFAPVE